MCAVCDKRFSRSDHLNDHMKIHSGHRPRICEFCAKGYVHWVPRVCLLGVTLSLGIKRVYALGVIGIIQWVWVSKGVYTGYQGVCTLSVEGSKYFNI